MLQLRQSQLQEQAAAESLEQSRVASRLRQMDMEETLPDLEVVLKTTDQMIVASRRVLIPTNDKVPFMLGPAFDEECASVRSREGQFSGPCFAIWHSSPESYSDEDVEAVYPIDRILPGNDQVKVYELPTILVAAVVHHGDVNEFTEGHKSLLKWVETNRYRINGAYREIYRDWRDRREATTEIQFPIEKVPQ